MNTRIAELARQAYIKDGIEKNPRYKPSGKVITIINQKLDSFIEETKKEAPKVSK